MMALDAEDFELVFTDLSMPEMDGWEVGAARFVAASLLR